MAGSRRQPLAEVICRIDARELPGTLALLEELRKGQGPYGLDQFVASLSRLGPNAKPAIPLLLELVNCGRVDPSVLATALECIGAEKEIWERPLLKMLRDRDAIARPEAARKLLRAEPGHAAAIAALIEITRGASPEGLAVVAIHELGDAGPLAKAAIPALREARKSQEKGQFADTLGAAATEALAKIEGKAVPK